MHKSMAYWLAGVLAVVTWGAEAGAGSKGAVSGYLTLEEAEVGPFEPDGLGLGVKGWLSLTPQFFANGEFQSAELDQDGFDIDVRQMRLGGGYRASLNPRTSVFGRLEAINFDGDIDDSGFGLHAGLMFNAAPDLGLYGSLGLIELDDIDGLELLLGGEYSFSRQFSGFVEYRSFDGDDVELNDLRAGVTWYFHR